MNPHTYRALALGAVLGFLVSVVPSCSSSSSTTGGTTCGPSNCATGCCNTSVTPTKCVTGTNTNNTTCGTAGLSCSDCTKTTPASVCTAATFKCSGGAGGGAGGGAAGGGTGGSVGGGAGGGTGGGAASTCGACGNGCCSGTTCFTPAFQSPTNCGLNASACSPCPSGQLCTNGVCGGSGVGGGTGGAAGGGAGGGSTAAGVMGAPCNADSECSGVGITTTEASAAGGAYKAFCKKLMNPTNNVYPGGYCTRRCLAQAACGAGNVCDFADGPYGEIDNICLAGCTGMGQGTCRTGYLCYQYTATASGCYPAYPDGGDIGPFDPGPGNSTGQAAGPCTDDTMCLPQVPAPALGFCSPGTLPDGGPTVYLGGQCGALCNQAGGPAPALNSDVWCGMNGACNGYQFPTSQLGPNANTGPSVLFICEQECTFGDGGVRSACRTGYRCTGGANGTCQPRCDNLPLNTACAPPNVCNATTGICGP